MLPPTSQSYRGRFAPSPTGALHFGSLIAALASWLRARAAGGVWLIRIEDLDPPREIAGAAQTMIDTLGAFGMISDETILWQHTRAAAYAQALEQLRRRDLAFPCWCSRNDLAASAGLHRGECTARPAPSRAAAWRARVPDLHVGFEDRVCGSYRQHLAREVGDFVIRRVEGYYAYQLAVVVDDAYQGITEVVRGADLLDSTPRQIWLQQQLNLARPEYLHLPLALGPDGRKLSKQDQSLPVDPDSPLPALRAALQFLGFPPAFARQSGSVDALLLQASAHFHLAAIPRPTLDMQLQHAAS